jgi:hypothetical protein
MPPKKKLALAVVPLSPGPQLVAAILAQLAEDGLEPDARDAALLQTAARLADRMAGLELMIASDGERSVSETGIVRLHPGIAEYRNHSIALAKVLQAVALSETVGVAKDPAKVRAAETRWRAHNLAKVQS